MSFVTDNDFVNDMGFLRWDFDSIQQRTENILASQFSDRQMEILQRKAIAMCMTALSISPRPFTPSADDIAKLSTYADLALNCGDLCDAMWVKAQRVNAAMDVEVLRTSLDTIPPVPLDPQAFDPYVEARAQAQATYDAAYSAAPADVKQLVDARYAYFHPAP